MAIRNDLLYKENIITKEQLEKVLNPLDEETLQEYGSSIGLAGYISVIKQYINKINDYLQYGDFNKNNKNYIKETESINIIRYHKKVNGEYVDCLADEEGAEEYTYTLNLDKYIQKDNVKKVNSNFLFKKSQKELKEEIKSDNVISELDIEIPNEFKSLLQCDITELMINFSKLEELFYTKNKLTVKVAINYLQDILTALEQAKYENEQQYLNKQYWNKQLQSQKLPFIKEQYIKIYNVYEDAKSAQSFYFVKAKHTNGKELDEGIPNI